MGLRARFFILFFANKCLIIPLSLVAKPYFIYWIISFYDTKKCKKAKWLSEEALQIAVKRREGKRKGEKERYTHLNEELQRIARREKKAFLSHQCKEIEENNRMGKTRDLFKKIIYQGNKSCKDGHNKGQKWYGLTEAEDIKILRTGGKNTQKNNNTKRSSQPRQSRCMITRARHPGMWSQEGLRKHHYKQS